MLNIYSRGDTMEFPMIIEDYDVDGSVTWIVSFQGCNPEGPYCVGMKNEAEAKKLVRIIEEGMFLVTKREIFNCTKE